MAKKNGGTPVYISDRNPAEDDVPGFGEHYEKHDEMRVEGGAYLVNGRLVDAQRRSLQPDVETETAGGEPQE